MTEAHPQPISWQVPDHHDAGCGTGSGSITVRGDRWGDLSDPPVLLLHGGGQTRHSWGSTAAVLADHGWCAMTYDQRGHGETDRSPTRSYAADRFATDLVSIARQLPAPPVVVGASLGGLAALRAEGAFAPGTLRGLVLVDITPRQERQGVDRIVAFMLDRVDSGFASLEEAAEAVADYQPHRAARPNTAGLEKNLRLGEDGRWRWHWDPSLFNAESGLHSATEPAMFVDSARALTIPTLLIRGRLSDLVSEETAQEFLDLVPHADYADVSDAGHMVAGDQNDRFTAAVVAFLDSLRT